MAAVVDDNTIRNLWGILNPRRNSPRHTSTNPTINAHPQPLATTSTLTPTPNHFDQYANPQIIPYRKDVVYVYRRAKDAISEEYRNRFPIVKDILRRNVEHDPKKKLLKYTALLSYELQMCGVSPEDAKPSILVNCPYSRTILKRLKYLFLQPHVKDQYHIDVALTPTTPYVPRFRLFFWAEERQKIWGRSDFVTIDTQGQHESEQMPKPLGLTMCGARVAAGEFGERCSTIGCLLRVGTQYYGLTSAHTFEESTTPPTDFEEDSDDSHLEDDEYDLNLPYPDNDGRPPPSLLLDEGSVNPNSENACEKTLAHPNSPPKHGIISPPVDDDTWTSRHPDSDWALVQVTDPSYWRPNIYFSPSEPHVPKFFSKFAPRLPTESRGVYLISSKSPAQYGTLHPIPAYIGGHGAGTCEVWTVSLSENQVPQKGDSGSIVIDARTKEVYGHAVAVTPLRDFYVMPLKDTLMEIQELLGTTDVNFPCNATLLTDLMFHYATTGPQSEELQHTIQTLLKMAEQEENSRQLQEALERYLKSNNNTFATSHLQVDLNIYNKNDASLCLQLLSRQVPSIKIKWLNNPEPYSFGKNAFPLAAGSFSTVYHVELCAIHFKKPFDCCCKQPPIRFACKTGRLNNDSERTQLDTEREVLTQLRQYSHPHIIDLLGSVQQEGKWGLLLPLAANDLDSMMTSDTPHQDQLYASWLLGQLRGLVSALKLVHSGLKEPETKSFLGWHGDVKPSNILFMRSPSKRTDSQLDGYGRLVLADFGLSRFQSKSRTKSATRIDRAFDLQQNVSTEQILADRQYIAPETEIEYEKSPAADIWSLGCVMLEVLVWIIYGAAGRQELLKELNTRERNPFWMVLEPSKVVLRPAVISWIERLEKNMKGDHVLFPALKLIRPGLLDPDPQKRLSSAALLERLEKPSAHPDLAQDFLGGGSCILGAWDSPQSTNIQTGLKHDLKCEAPDKAAQPNSPLARVNLLSGSTGLAITTEASCADRASKSFIQTHSGSVDDGINSKSDCSANSQGVKAATQEGKCPSHQGQGPALDQKIAPVHNPRNRPQGDKTNLMQLTETFQELDTEEQDTMS